ncbi:hypothetical protein HZB01_04490 [Candidatus Woesearchaeota archaeon]|nr:hypothetical protein [Candidatus Woesearchaeota archaeon]
MEEGSKTVETNVDSLVHLLRNTNQLSLHDAAKKLDLPVETIEAWANFLEEEGILHIVYRFTTPYLVYSENASQTPNQQKPELSKEDKEVEALIALIKKAKQHLKNNEFKLAKEAHGQLRLFLKNMPADNIKQKKEVLDNLRDLEKKLFLEIITYSADKAEEPLGVDETLDKIKVIEQSLQLKPIDSGEKKEITTHDRRNITGIKFLLEEAYEHLQKREFEQAKDKYAQIRKVYQELPNSYLEEGHDINQKLVKLNKDLATTMESVFAEEVHDKYDKILELLEIAGNCIKENKVNAAAVTYNEIKKLYASLPNAFIEKKIELQNQILEVYHELITKFDQVSASQIKGKSKEIEGLIAQAKGYLKEGKLHLAIKTYHTISAIVEKLPHGFMEKKIELETKVLELNKLLMQYEEQLSLRMVDEGSKRIDGLFAEGEQLLQKGNIEGAGKIYSEIKQSFNKLPDGFIERKTKIQERIVVFDKRLVGASEKAATLDFKKKTRKIEELLDSIDKFLGDKEVDLAEEAYGETLYLFSKLPPGFLNEKVQLRLQLLSYYKQIILHHDKTLLSNVDEETQRIYHQLLKLLIDAQQNIKHGEYEMLTLQYKKIIPLFSKLPLGFVQQRIKIRDEIMKVYYAVMLYLKTKELDLVVKNKNYDTLRGLLKGMKETYELLAKSPFDVEFLSFINTKYNHHLSLLTLYERKQKRDGTKQMTDDLTPLIQPATFDAARAADATHHAHGLHHLKEVFAQDLDITKEHIFRSLKAVEDKGAGFFRKLAHRGKKEMDDLHGIAGREHEGGVEELHAYLQEQGESPEHHERVVGRLKHMITKQEEKAKAA